MRFRFAWILGLLVAGQGTTLAAQRPTPIHVDSTEALLWIRALPRLATALDRVDSAERAYQFAHRTYSAGLDSLGVSPRAGSERVVMLWADSTGWRAAALSDSGRVGACFLSGGSGASALPSDSFPGGVRCRIRGALVNAPHGVPDHPLLAVMPAVSVHQEKPEQRCRPLQMTPEGTRMLGHSQTVMLEFIIDTTGAPQIAGAVFSGADNFAGTDDGIESLAMCHFRPARVDGHAIRVSVDMPLNLIANGNEPAGPQPHAPDATCPQAAQGCSTAVHDTSSGPRQFQLELSERLQSFADARWILFGLRLTFGGFTAVSVTERPSTDRPRDSGARVILMADSDTGWSEIAFHDSLPDVVCGVYYGNVPPPLNPRASSGEVVCRGMNAATLPPPSPFLSVHRLHLDTELSPDERPRTIACGEVKGMPDEHGPKQWAWIRAVIDTAGRLLPAPIRVVKAPSFMVVREALWVIQNCRYSPGHINNVPIETSVVIPVMIGDH